MAHKNQERDWDRELAEVDKLLNQLPTHREEQAAAARHAAPPRAPGAPPLGAGGGVHPIGTWVRVALGLALGIAMTQWPYAHGCGVKLFLYLGGVFTIIVAGVWSGLSSWKRRLGLAHVFSQGLVIWGLILAAGVILPRIGYAKSAATWFCH